MKLHRTVGMLLLGCSSMLAQSSSSSQSGGQSTGMSSNMQMEPGQKSQGKSGMQDHMQQMQADLQQMKSRVEKMRADAEKVQDPNTKAALLDNADMWEQFTNRMQSHMDMMMKGGMHHGGMVPGQKSMMRGKPSQAPQTGQPSTPKSAVATESLYNNAAGELSRIYCGNAPRAAGYMTIYGVASRPDGA